MGAEHLKTSDLERYAEKTLDDRARAEVEKHLTECAGCRARLTRERQIEGTLRTLPRREPPRDLAARIGSAVELQVFQARLRRARLPFIVGAMCFSVLLMLWFGFQMIIALDENGTLDFFSILSSRPDVLSAYSVDAIWALIETLPLGEIVLTLFALFTVIVLAQQWVDTLRPRAPGQLRRGV
ncbi:MAG: zf-HC2 domain-containing protein [Chloroflexota bacterium]|nr:zf-HC2 domain-containing protein [Chloroflexota bacterium]